MGSGTSTQWFKVLSSEVEYYWPS